MSEENVEIVARLVQRFNEQGIAATRSGSCCSASSTFGGGTESKSPNPLATSSRCGTARSCTGRRFGTGKQLSKPPGCGSRAPAL